MFRYLTVLLFLLILFPLLNIGDASSVSAQSFTYEDGSYWLPDIEIKGNENKVICNCCGESFYDEDALNVHIRHNSVCADYYGIPYEQEDGDDDADKPKDGKCYGCGKSIEECTCIGVDCSGNSSIGNSDNWNTGSSSGSSSSGGYWYPNNNDAKINPPYNPIHKKNDDEHLFRNDLPAKSMRQNTRMNCVPTAIANMLSHMGSMQSAEDLRRNIENVCDDLYAEKYGKVQYVGIQQGLIDQFLSVLECYNIDLADIVSYIDSGHPCLGIIEIAPGCLHMVEIVGYFDNDDSTPQSMPEFYQCVESGTGEYTTIRIERFEKYSKNIYSR